MEESGLHLTAIVAEWLANGQQPVDAANDPRDHTLEDWFTAFDLTLTLVNSEMVRWADEAAASEAFAGGGPYTLVVPTAKGIFWVLSP